jgi:hypothetical protein
VRLDLRRGPAYGIINKTYTNYVSQLYLPNASYPIGSYLLQVTNFGSVDIFIEIAKPAGITTQLTADSGIFVDPLFRVDLEFYRINLPSMYNWVSFDGAVATSGFNITARYVVINPNPNIIIDDTSIKETDFISYLYTSYTSGIYYVGVFTNEDANATIKIATSSTVLDVGITKMDQNVTFNQTGQTYYIKIPQSQSYFIFAGYSNGPPQSVAYTMMSPTMSIVWRNQSTGTYSIFAPSKTVYQYYIMRVQGQGGFSAMIHNRFEGMEDFNIQTPDSSNYTSRFPGDLVLSNIAVRNSDIVAQHIGNMIGNSCISFYDTALIQKTYVNFTNGRQDNYQRWRKGFENPSQGNWLEIYLDISAPNNQSRAEINTLQSGDESLSFATPLQIPQTNPYTNSWNVESYSVRVDAINWFGLVSQMLTLNTQHPYHPYLSIWVYDPDMTELSKNQALNSTHTFDTDFWPSPRTGNWTIIVAGYQDSLNLDPLNCTVSFVGNTDFKRDWPTDLSGTASTFQVTVGTQTRTVEVLSNSSISNFSFNPANSKITFDTAGPSGTVGFCVVTIPLQVAPRPFEVTLDNQPISDALSQQNDTHSSIYMSYSQSNHQISLLSTVYTAPTPSPTATPSASPPPSHTPTPSPTPSHSPTPSPTNSPNPTNTPNPTSTPTPSTQPTQTTQPANPTQSPSAQPGETPEIPEMTIYALFLIVLATLAAVAFRTSISQKKKKLP